MPAGWPKGSRMPIWSVYRIHRQPLVAQERLPQGEWARIQAGLAVRSAGEVGAAYLAKELLRELYAATPSSRLAGGSSTSTRAVATPTSSSSADSPPWCDAGSKRSSAGVPRGCPTD